MSTDVLKANIASALTSIGEGEDPNLLYGSIPITSGGDSDVYITIEHTDGVEETPEAGWSDNVEAIQRVYCMTHADMAMTVLEALDMVADYIIASYDLIAVSNKQHGFAMHITVDEAKLEHRTVTLSHLSFKE